MNTFFRKKIFIFIVLFTCMFTVAYPQMVLASVQWCHTRGNGDERAEEQMGLVDLGYKTDENLYNQCCANWYSVEVIEDMLNRGYMSGYVQQLKDGGWIPNDFVPTPVSNTVTETPTTPPTSTETTVQPQPPVAEPESEPEVTYTQEDIDAAWKESKRVESTCTKEGYIQYKNGITGEKKKDVLPMLEHTYEKTEVAATCEEVGMVTYTCAGCDDTYTEELPAVGHSFTEKSRKEATCTNEGIIVYACELCGSEKEEVLAATGHDEGEWFISKDAELFSDGLKELRCTKDGAVLSSQIINQTSPFSLTSVIIVLVCVIGFVSAVVIVSKKKLLK